MPSVKDSQGPLTQDYIKQVLQSSEAILNADEALAARILNVSKWMFDQSQKYGEAFSPLQELITDGFDEEQIWEQMLLEYEPKLSFFEKLFVQAEHITAETADRAKNDQSDADVFKEKVDNGSTEKEDDVGQDDGQGQGRDQENVSETENDQENVSETENDQENVSETENDLDLDQEEQELDDYNGVDDEFFSLKEMEKFADVMEKDESVGDAGSDMDFIDSEMLFQDPDALVDDQDIENANDIRYEDFFGRSKKPDLTVRSTKEKELREPDRFLEEDEAPVTVRPLDLEDESESEDEKPKSRFEKQQEKLKKVISELEAEAVAEKDWALKGEVNATKRPKNSLLEHTLDVDYASKPVPVVTEESTASLEDIIKQRVKDELWDDVIRKVVIQEREFDPNKVREANDTKNSKSLAEVYEQEYLKQTQEETFKGEKDEALLKDHDEIKKIFNGLTQALDALSNAYFTPKAPVLEVKVLPRLDVPAISMEEVIPANVSDSKLVTPREVYSTNIKKSKEEMDSKDHKRDRAAFKAQQKKLRVLKEKARKDADATKTTSRKRLSDEQADKNKALKELMGHQNVTIISDKSNKQKLESGKGIKASVIQKGGKVEQEHKRSKTEHIKL